jgi:tetratricopeptide (TPR) repeat protein
MVERLLKDELPLEPFMVSPPAYSPAFLALEEGKYKEALGMIDSRISDLQGYGTLAELPESLLLKGKVLFQLGEKENALALWQDALELAQKLNNHRVSWQIHLALEDLDTDFPHREKAIEGIRYITDRIENTDLKTTFLNALPAGLENDL